MKFKNIFNENDEININTYCKKCGIGNVEEYLKGNTVEKTTNYNNIDEWSKTLHEYIDKQIHLLVDSDFDGYGSGSLFYTYVKLVNPNADIAPYFHHSNPKCHGLGDDTFEQIKLQEPSLLVILDASSNDEKYCKELEDLGWKIILADHHFSKHYNRCCVLVNNQESKNVINKGLCGTGVTWKCLKRYDELYEYNYANKLISYVAIANVSDSMNITYQENRAFAKWGFSRIHDNLKPFFEYFIKDLINNETVVWELTPKVNATIRLGDLELKKKMFYALCGEIDANEVLSDMKTIHTKQTNEKKRIYKNSSIIYNGTCILAKVSEPTSLTGLVANMLSSDYLKPILLVRDKEDGICGGSVRSVVPIRKKLEESGLFNSIEGHPDYAFGIEYDKSKEQELIDYLDNSITLSEPCEDVLMSYSIKCIPSYLYRFKNDYIELWSKGLDKPQFHIKPFEIYNTDIRTLGKGNTIKFTVNDIDFIMFFVSNKMKEELKLDEMKQKIELELIVELCYNEFRGKKTKQAIIQKYEISKPKEKTFEDIFGF